MLRIWSKIIRAGLARNRRIRGTRPVPRLALPDRHQRLPKRPRQSRQRTPSAPGIAGPSIRPHAGSRPGRRDCLARTLPRPRPGGHCRYGAGSRRALRVAQGRVQLAFVTMMQHLPPRQRAVLLLCDVMGWSANETARLLEASAASVNSALQRARATLAKRFPSGRPEFQPAPDDRQRGLLDRYMRAWEGSVSINLSRSSARMPSTACRRGATGIAGARQFGPYSDGPGDPMAAFVSSLHPLTCNGFRRL